MKDKVKLLKDIEKSKIIFDDLLLNKNYMYIYRSNTNNKIEFFEVKCMSNNFLHLTGVKTSLKPSLFYSAIENNKLSLNQIDYKENGTTKLKLDIFEKLPLLFNSPIQVCFQDNFFTLKLSVDILLNRSNLNQKDIVLGLKRDKKFDFFIPASILKIEPKVIGKDFSRVLCILEKDRKEKKYSNIKYKVKDLEVLDILKEIDIELIDNF